VFNFNYIYYGRFKFCRAGLIVIGAVSTLGIGGSAMDAIARQPEASGKIKQLCLSCCIN
jgi:F0F1-type ATP synthase membrane subunit c/vacuolar-type H+-ATPase subunit K